MKRREFLKSLGILPMIPFSLQFPFLGSGGDLGNRTYLPVVFNGAGKVQYYQEVLSLLGSSLLGYWPGWDSSGLVTDQSGNGNNGALVGTAAFGAIGIGDGRTMLNLGAAGGVNVFSTALRDAFNSEELGLGGWYAGANDVWTDGAIYLGSVHADTNNRVFMRATAADFTMYYIAGGLVRSICLPPLIGTRLVHLMIGASKSGDMMNVFINGSPQNVKTGLGTWAGLPILNGMYMGANQANGNNFKGRIGHNVLMSAMPTSVQAQALALSKGVICFEGDSRTDAKSWPFKAAEAGTPGGLFAFGGRGVSCLATGGANYLIHEARISTLDALVQPGKSNILVFWSGVNSGALAGGLYAWTRDYLITRRAAGWNKIVWCSEISANVLNWDSSNRPAFNTAWTADTTTADVKVDLGMAPELQDYTNTTYFKDGIHLTDAGYEVVRRLVTAGILEAALE